MSITRTIKTQFDAARELIRNKEIPNDLRHFWTSNDQFSLAEDDFPDFNSGKTSQGEEKGIVNLFVGEADIFSAIHKIEGDIIICDIDRTLLRFIVDQKNYLQALYRSYKTQQMTFDQVFSSFKTWMENYDSPDTLGFLERRMLKLGSAHFLDSEENFQRAMEALQTKNLVTLDINLFDKREQDALCAAIKSAKAKVKIFNLTNLPDYDRDDSLSYLIGNLPWAANSQIVWNIHDRGAFKEYKEWMVKNRFYIDPYTHYLFIASNPVEYREHVSKRPSFYAEIDVVDCVRRKITKDDIGDFDLLRRYLPNTFIQYLQDLENPENRKQYIEHLDLFFQIIKDRNIEDVTREIYNRYQVRLSPRHRIDENWAFFQLITKHQQLKKIKSDVVANCSDPLMKSHLLNLIDMSIKNITAKRIQEDLEKNKLLQSQLEEDFNQISFLNQFVQTTNTIREVITNRYNKPDQKPIIEKSQKLLTEILADVRQRSSEFKKPEGQINFKNDMVAKVQKHKFQHRIFDTEKHNVLKVFLNAIMLIPLFGLIKLAATGTYFFHAATRREQIFVEEVQNTPSASKTYSS